MFREAEHGMMKGLEHAESVMSKGFGDVFGGFFGGHKKKHRGRHNADAKKMKMLKRQLDEQAHEIETLKSKQVSRG